MHRNISFIGDVLDDLAAFCQENQLVRLHEQIMDARAIFQAELAAMEPTREIRTSMKGAVVVDAGLRRTH